MINTLFQAVQTNDVEVLKKLLSKDADLANMENEEGLTPLGYAAHFGHKGAVQLLLDYGANVNTISHSKINYIPSNTALHAAIAGERNLDVISLLLAHQAKTDIFDSNGQTCLHTAAYHSYNQEIIKLLIDNGAQLNAKTKDGKTAFEIAMEQKHYQIAQILKDGK